MKHIFCLPLLLLAFPIWGQTSKTCTYSGPKLSLTDNKVNVTAVGPLVPASKTYFQGMAIHGDWLVSMEHSGVVTIYSLNGGKMQRKGTLRLGSCHKTNHCNSANFGPFKAAPDDPMPLLYVSRCHTAPLADGLARLAFVERMDPVGMHSELVQRIHLNTAPQTLTGNSTWAIDKDNHLLICLTNTVSNKGKGNRHMLQRFRLPEYRGPQDSLVILTSQDALDEYYLEDYYNKPFSPIMQGLCVKDGLLFIPVGIGTSEEPSILYVWDLQDRCMRNEINLQAAIPSELEDCDYRNGSLYMQTQTMGILRLDFME